MIGQVKKVEKRKKFIDLPCFSWYIIICSQGGQLLKVENSFRKQISKSC